MNEKDLFALISKASGNTSSGRLSISRNSNLFLLGSSTNLPSFDEANIEQLEVLSPSLSIEKKISFLRDTVEKTKKPEKRKTLGETPSFISSLEVELQSLEKEHGSDILKKKKELELLTYLARVFRNLCIESTANQNVLRNIANIFIPYFKNLLKSIPWKQTDSNEVKFARIGMQFIGNFITSNLPNQELIWNQFFPHFFLEFLKIEDRHFIAYILTFLYNSIWNHTERRKLLVFDSEGTKVLRLILRASFADQQVAEDEPFEWIFFIVLSLLIDNSLPTMHFNLAYHKDFNADELSDPKSFKTTHEQVILFKLIDGIVDSQDEKTDAIVTELLCRFLTQELCKLCSLYTFTSNEEQIPLSSNDVEAIFLLFQILANISQYIKFHQAFIEEGLLDKTLELLLFTWKHEKELQAQSTKNEVSGNTLFSFSFKLELIRIIGNLSYKNRYVQDEVRNKNAIILVLNHCNIDENFPFIREWSIFAIHNLCEDNIENQKFISSLKLEKLSEIPELSKIGLELSLENGKLKIKRKEEDY